MAPQKQGLRELVEKMRKARAAARAAEAKTAEEAAGEKPMERYRREKIKRLMESLRRKRSPPFNTLG